MTTTELAKMMPEEKRVKIAKACGWEQSVINGEYWYRPDMRRNGQNAERPPNYPESLDAMHAAIMAQPLEFRKAMRLALYALTDQMSAHFADAPTMADAFLMTLK
jgi:hypothetical protein